MRSRKKCSCTWRNKKALPFLLPSLAGVSIFVLVPFVDVVRRSFMTAMSGEYAGLANYRTILTNRAFRLAAANTLHFMAVCLPLLLAGSLAVALGLYHFPALEKCKRLYLLPMAMPAATIVLVWKLLFAGEGLWNGFLRGMGLPAGTDYLTDRAFGLFVGTYLWKNLGYTVVLWLAALKAVPGDILEAARVDGAGGLRTFWYVTLPCLRGSLYTITVLSFLNAFKVFREAYLLNGAYPPEEIYLLQHVFHNWYVNLDLDKMAAGAVLAVLALGSVCVALKRLWEKG